MKNTGLKIISSCLLLLFTGCYAREMYMVDPVVSFQEQGIKNVLYLGFVIPPKVNLSGKIKDRLNNALLKEFDRFSTIKLVKPDEKELNLTYPLKTESLKALSQRYQSDLFVLGEVRDFKEVKYLDQPPNALAPVDTSIPVPAGSNGSFVRYQLAIDGNLALLKPDGKPLWVQKIDEVESIQYEDATATQETTPGSQEELVLISTREKLIENIVNKVIRNLLPYYNYK